MRGSRTHLAAKLLLLLVLSFQAAWSAGSQARAGGPSSVICGAGGTTPDGSSTGAPAAHDCLECCLPTAAPAIEQAFAFPVRAAIRVPIGRPARPAPPAAPPVRRARGPPRVLV